MLTLDRRRFEGFGTTGKVVHLLGEPALWPGCSHRAYHVRQTCDLLPLKSSIGLGSRYSAGPQPQDDFEAKMPLTEVSSPAQLHTSSSDPHQKVRWKDAMYLCIFVLCAAQPGQQYAAVPISPP